jgi:hypothetical protein
MARKNGGPLNAEFGKDHIPRGGGNEAYIEHALRGGHGASEGIDSESIGNGQVLHTSFPVDNVSLAMPIESSVRETGGIRGGPNYVGHSLHGATVVNDDMLSAGSVKHHMIKDH